jgi:protein-tyrosine phosphatase
VANKDGDPKQATDQLSADRSEFDRTQPIATLSSAQFAGYAPKTGEKSLHSIPAPQTKLLFVCTGNICRSPTAEGIALSMIERNGWQDRFAVDSAGTHNYHAGDPPDPRSIEHAAKRGYDLSTLRARRVDAQDFTSFQYILALDMNHLRHLTNIQASGLGQTRSTVTMLTCESALFKNQPVADPYYSGPEAFDATLDMIEESLECIFAALLAGKKLLPPAYT